MLRVLLQKIKYVLQTFADAQAGSLPIIFALTAPVLFLLVGGGIEYSKVISQKNKLQGYADRAALAAAKEFSISQDDDDRTKAIAKSIVIEGLRQFKKQHANSFMAADIKVETIIDDENSAVKVRLTQATIKDFPINGFEIETVSVVAEASVVGNLHVCVIGLDESATATISLEQSARLTGKNCAVYSNSTSGNGIVAKNNAVARASLFCTAGGASGSDGFTPAPTTDCPNFPDPLADRIAPTIGACDHKWLQIYGREATLSPGVYCGGLEIYDNANVTFEPGIYIIKDGPFNVSFGGKITGENVSFYLTGSRAQFNFGKDSTIALSATKDGPLAGLLFFEDRNKTKAGRHIINSDNARLLLGTIYLPSSHLIVDANAPVADQSAYTAIVALSLKLYSGPHLILNTNYSDTDVPVPENIKGLSSNVILTK